MEKIKGTYTHAELVAGFFNETSREKFFRLIVEEFQQRLYYFIRRIVITHEDTDDVLQEVFIKAWRKLNQLEKPEQLSAWLYRIAHNECMNQLSSSHRNKSAAIDETNFQIADSNHPLNAEEWNNKVHVAIQQLPLQQKTVFNLRYFDEMPYAQISEVMQISEGGAKALFHHAMKKMQSMLGFDEK